MTLFDLAQNTIAAAGVSPTTAAAAVAGVGTAGAGVWFTRFMVTRMIRQFDEALKCASEKIRQLEVKVAVLEARASDRREAEIATYVRIGSAEGRVDKLNKDVGAAHRRIEALLARGEPATDLQTQTKDQTP
jgi:Zn-dependent protease with chaperone function